MSQEFAFWHYPHEDTGGAQINGQFPLYDRGHIAEVPDAATRSRWAASSKASLILLFDPATPGPIGASVASTIAATTLTTTGSASIGTTASAGRFTVQSSAATDFNRDIVQRVGDATNYYRLSMAYNDVGSTIAGFPNLSMGIYLEKGGSFSNSGGLVLGTQNGIGAPIILAPGGAEAVRVAESGNVGFNETLPDYKLDVNGTFGFTPGASVTPVDNGDIVFEATSNTTFTIKHKGADGTVRSGTVTLA